MIKTEHLSDSVTLHLGDCREVLPTLARADVTITDPPYAEKTHAGARTGGVWQPDKHETIYVKIEDDNEPYYIADESADNLVEMGQTVKIGVYQLVEIVDATGAATFGKPVKPR